MGLGCNCDVLELFQSVQNANTSVANGLAQGRRPLLWVSWAIKSAPGPMWPGFDTGWLWAALGWLSHSKIAHCHPCFFLPLHTLHLHFLPILFATTTLQQCLTSLFHPLSCKLYVFSFFLLHFCIIKTNISSRFADNNNMDLSSSLKVTSLVVVTRSSSLLQIYMCSRECTTYLYNYYR